MTDLHLSRDELASLTGTVQPKRMAAWLTARGWVFEPATRRSGIPVVARAYHDARMTGRSLAPETRRARPRLDFFAEA